MLMNLGGTNERYLFNDYLKQPKTNIWWLMGGGREWGVTGITRSWRIMKTAELHCSINDNDVRYNYIHMQADKHTQMNDIKNQ